MEIQTGSLFRTAQKLERMLPHYPVTVVYPAPPAKRLIWVEEDGTLSDPHPSPKKGSAMDAFDQLVYLAPLLGHPRLTVRLVLLDLDEYRRRTAGAGTANVAHRLERVPRSDEKGGASGNPELYTTGDYGQLPCSTVLSLYLPGSEKAVRRSAKQVQGALLHFVYFAGRPYRKI